MKYFLNLNLIDWFDLKNRVKRSISEYKGDFEMDKEFTASFVYGYLYAKAEDIKSKGMFNDLTTKELVSYMIKTYSEQIKLSNIERMMS